MITRLPFTLRRIMRFIRGTNTLKLIVILFARELEKGMIATPFVSAGAQLVDLFTKPLFKPRLELCNKLGLCDIYSPA